MIATEYAEKLYFRRFRGFEEFEPLFAEYRLHKFNILLFYFISMDILFPRSIFIDILLISCRMAYVRVYVFYKMLKTGTIKSSNFGNSIMQ